MGVPACAGAGVGQAGRERVYEGEDAGREEICNVGPGGRACADRGAGKTADEK